MSQRVKKPGRSADDSQGKRRLQRRRLSGSDADEDGTRSGSNSGGNGSLTGMWTPRHLNDLKVSSIYNRNSAEAPAELYRKDLISAMKLPDSEPLTPEEYWLITDSWKQEWEKGVQVPVNPESLPEPEVKLIQPAAERSHDFRLPKKKYVRVTHDDFFNPDYHQLVSTAARAEKVCSYDLDDVDAAWLGCSNADRAMQNMTLISEFLMEQVIEELELQCWEQVQTILKSQEGLGIEYDENVICDVCRSPESEEGNEMVFCDSCNICVHQACYGITTIPSGSWLCRTCTLGIKPTCVLCPNVGGAMKATRSGHTWAHVACAIWIPEVSIGSVEKMEPITKISSIPQSRWSLICVLCKEKTGACIQCSVKTCKTAYHVTCAFKNGLEMKPIIVDENAEDGIKLRSYCQKHSVNTKKDKSQSENEEDAEKKKIKAMTAEERNQARAEKLQQIEAEFYKYVRLKDVSQNLAVDMDIVILIYNYWKLKRKSLNNRPLVPPRPETTQLLTQQQEQDLEQMKMFVQLRQDLERVRNLCYMVSRREKLSRSYFRLREQTFQKQLALLTEENDLTPEERQAILNANHGPSIYDQLYSHQPSASTATTSSASAANKATVLDYEALISLIAGMDAKKDLVNGVIKSSSSSSSKKQGKLSSSGSGASTSAAAAAAAAAVTDAVNSALSNINNHSNTNSSTVTSVGNTDKATGANPYKKQFVNGARRRNILGRDSGASSHSESENERTGASTSDNITPPAKANKKASAAGSKGASGATVPSTEGKTKGGNRKPLSYLFDSDSSETAASPAKKSAKAALAKTAKGGKVKGGKQSGAATTRSNKSVKTTSYLSDSDELELPVTRTTNKAGTGQTAAGKDTVPIYSDSEESAAEDVKPAVTTPQSKKDSKAKTVSPVGKEKTGKKAKGPGSAQGSTQNLSDKVIKREDEDKPLTAETKGKKPAKDKTSGGATTPKGKTKAVGSKKGRNKAGFNPTELIVPQREAAKKATESIRSVKQKTKDQPASADGTQESPTAPAAPVSKETVKEVPKSTSKALAKTIVSTLSDSENEEEKVSSRPASRKGKSPERKGSGKVAKKAGATAPGQHPVVGAAIEDETGDVKDEFDFELSKDGSSKNVPSYVPQRQAAKKAAEHIRSGLSNIVAARLIIEDEMELARKKQKLEKGQISSGGKGIPGKDEVEEPVEDSSKIENAVAEAAKKVTSKERVPAKGQVKTGKGNKKEVTSAEQQSSSATTALPNSGPKAAAAASAATKEARGVRDTSDWPFLSQGSQSACRRSRERSSSSTSSSGSSGSSSSGSSCSSRSSSASSSRSSSAESASPEPRSPVVTKKASCQSQQQQQQQIITSVTNKLSNSTAQDSGPGRKLKTSERCPNSRTRLRAETPPREKPATKSGRPPKSGSRGGDPFRSAFSPSPEPEPKPASSEPPQQQSKKQQQQRQQQQSNDKRSSTPADNNKVSPFAKANEQQQRKQQQQQQRGSKSKSRSPGVSEPKTVTPESPEKKGPRRKGEPPSSAGKVTHKTTKDGDVTTAAAAHASLETTALGIGEKRSEAKASVGQSRKSPVKHTGPHLSSESETETTPEPVAARPKASQKSSSRSTTDSHNQSESNSNLSPSQRKRKLQPEASCLGLSDSEESGAEEKENAAVPAEHQQVHRGDIDRPSTPVSTKPTQKTPQKSTPPAAGTQSSQSILSPLTPAENKDKEQQLPRLSDTEQPDVKRPKLDGSTPGAPSTSIASSGQMKSIFSPPGSTGGGRDGEILDFDSELYDLARSVTEEYNQGEDGPNSGSLSFSFSQELFSREDNKEDSARATLNLVEKLRLQHARKSGVHRPSTESSLEPSCDGMLDDVTTKSDSRPGSSLQDDRKDNISEISEPAQISELMSEAKNTHSHAGSFEQVSRSKSPQNLVPTPTSPDRTKQSIQGDERWVPPSATSTQPPEQNRRHPASQVFIPNASASSPRTPYANIPEQSPPIPAQQPLSSHHSRVDGSSVTEQEKHLIRSPASSSCPSSQPAHIRPHGSRTSTSDNIDKTNNNLIVDTHSTNSPVVPSPMVSPIMPGLHQGRQSQPGITPPPFAAVAAALVAAADASPSNLAAAAAAGLPFGANPFMYPALANNPAFATAFAAAAAAAAGGAPNPLAPFLQVPMPKTSPGMGPGSPVNFPQQGAPGFPPFLPAAVMQQAQQQQQQQQNTVHTPTPSPVISSGQQQQQQQQQQQSQAPAQQQSQQRRPSDVAPMAEGKMPINTPPMVSVAASMPPPLAKPPLTSPSILFAANNVKTVTPPPLQSAVAHIIESVVNNHSSNNSNKSLPKTTLAMDLHLPATTASVVAPASTNTQVKAPLTSPVVGNVAQQHKQQSQQMQSAVNENMGTDLGSVLASKTTENIITPPLNKAGRQASGENPASAQPVSTTTTATSPKTAPPTGGRGRRASTPRASAASAKAAAEKLSGVNAVIEDMMMVSPQTKSKGRKATAQSPGRGKAPATPARRGGSGGRGRGKGKNVVGVRKDLAGTVYDIDFDEFEENSEEKIDLRALRERRKSNDVHAHIQEIKEKETKSSRKSKSSASHHTSDHSQNSSLGPIVLTLPIPHGDKHSRSRSSYHDKEEGHKERKSRTKEAKEAKEVDRHESRDESHVGTQQQPHQPPLVTTISVSKGEIVSSTNKIPTTTAVSTPTSSSTGNSGNEKGDIHSMLQAPLPGPVDMRTYSATTSATSARGDEPAKIDFQASLAVKDPTSEIASLFMSSTTSSTVVPGNEIEDVEKALEVLVSTPKSQSTPQQSSSGVAAASTVPTLATSVASDAHPTAVGSQQPSTTASAVNDVISSVNVNSNISQISKPQNNTQNLVPTTLPATLGTVNSFVPDTCPRVVDGPFRQVQQASKDDMLGRVDQPQHSNHAAVVPTATIGESDLSRNQLKVKIKGPFLDANYSSTNSMPPGSIPTHPHLHPSHSLQQQNPSTASHPFSHTGYPPPHGLHSQNYGGSESASFQHHQHHQHQQWMMSSMMGGNTSNLRRMRKKELLRQYWTQDMNMDGGSNVGGFPPQVGAPQSHMSEYHGGPGSHQGQHPHHPLGRSVITIPKAVASMSIIPTKEDYRLDNPSGNDSNDSNGPGGLMGELWSGKGDQSSSKGAGGSTGKTEGTQKKRRSRGIYREMAALGIIPPDATPRERRRDRNAASSSTANASGDDTNDSNSRKRMRGSSKPSRSTFIPPTLVDSVDSPTSSKTDKTTSLGSSSSNSTAGKNSASSAVSAVVNVVNHPTPKLKIKFGDLSSASGNGGAGNPSGGSGSAASSLANNINHLSDSDKEGPNKKAKGRPPKKRGLPDAASSSSTTSSSTGGFSMEELKRESMKYREKIMKDYAMAEQQEILKLSGTRRKKRKRKGGASAAGSETDDTSSVRSKSPEVKVIDGPKPKLILRFGKARSNATGDNSVTSGDKVNENGLPGSEAPAENSGQGAETTGENDSGFTGSSEGSTGSVSENLKGNGMSKGKEKGSSSSSGSTNNNNNNNNKSNNSHGGNSASSSSCGSIKNGSSNSSGGNNGDKVLILELDNKTTEKLNNLTSSSSNPPKEKNNVPGESSSSSSSSTTGEKYVPIRLKLSRCYEGYSLKNKDGLTGPLDVGVDRENGGASNATKQSDSCQVR